MPGEEPLADDFASRLAERFAERVMEAADLPPVRKAELFDSCEVTRDSALLHLACTITGCSYERPWDGSESEAVALVDDAADSTAHLIARTPHYAWMRSKR
jgi:hypothetical protein